MARVLIVGCGGRGRRLAVELAGRGHQIRGTTRRAEVLPQIAAAGAEAVLADPDRIATLVPALDHVSVAVLLLGTATGSEDELAALFGSRLEMLMLKLLDTTARGVVFETAGTVAAPRLAAGAAVVRGACEGSRIPYAPVDAEPASGGWLAAAVGAVEAVLAAA